VITGKRRPCVDEQITANKVGYSIVTTKQEASILSRMTPGRFLAVRDLYHFSDTHAELIEYAAKNDFLGNPFLPISRYSDHVQVVMRALIRHAFDFRNHELAHVLLVYLLSLADVDEAYVEWSIGNFFGHLGPRHGVAEIREEYRKIEERRERAAQLDKNMSHKPRSWCDGRDNSGPLKV
jgi:hypothetical protein